MPENELASPSSMNPAAPLPVRPAPRWRWLLVAAVGALIVAAFAARWLNWAGKAAAVPPTARPAAAQPMPLDGKLNVIVRPPERAVEPLPVEERGALPVREGGIMSLEVQLNQPAFTYLVWLDCEGRVLPLYPWNTESLDVTDVNQPPPLRRTAKVIYSPLLGGGWMFGKRGGVETVILLARRTPLENSASLGSLLAALPPPRLGRTDELLVLQLDRGDVSVKTLLAKSRGDEQEASAADEPLRQVMTQLSADFELIRAVRFAHEGE